MKIKATYYLVLTVALMALSATRLPVYASSADDERIEAAAENSYVFKNYLKDDDIEIRSNDGTVSLYGTVSEESHKALAQDTVSGLPGVISVDNRLEVNGERPAENSDAWLTDKVKTTLLLHQNVSSTTEVSAKDGTVTLRGDATSHAQKELTTEYVKDVEGVKNVQNEMTVRNNLDRTRRTVIEIIDDSSITAQVRMALLLHRSTSVISTGVTTKNGVVTLTGRAMNSAEKDLVTKLVNDIKGVNKVENLMTIEGSR